MNQGHNIWAFFLWACFKEGFTSGGLRWVNQNSVFAIIEIMIALPISGQLSVNTFLIYLGMILFFNLRQKYTNAVQITMAFFLLYYFSMNFCLNFFDLIWNFCLKGIKYKHDDDFVSSFSYKSH